MELGTTNDIYQNPLHPYTKALISSTPYFRGEKIILKGDVPSAFDKPKGCPFAPRCPERIGDICFNVTPELVQKHNNVRCHLYSE
jgi:oligopeptide/dipeptide ABC transporter ATP-binding protein